MNYVVSGAVIRSEREEAIVQIVGEHLRLFGFFIDYFRRHPEIDDEQLLTPGIYEQPESWFTARMKKFSATHALSRVVENKTIRINCRQFRLMKKDFANMLSNQPPPPDEQGSAKG